MKTAKKLLLPARLVLAALLVPCTLLSEGDGESLSGAYGTIDPLDVYSYCREIASGRYEGRLTGHEGYTAAAAWAAGKFEEWGLKKPVGLEGYLQPYPSPYSVVDEAELVLYVAGEGGDGACDTLSLENGVDFIPQLFTDSGDARAGLVFAGWGISAPDLGYDDYEGIDPAGKFVVCFRGTPDRSRREFDEHDHHRRRMDVAKGRGALGLFYIYPEPIANPNGDWIEGFTAAIISSGTADTLLAERGITSDGLRERLLESGSPESFELGSEAHYTVSARHFPDGIGYNVVGYVEGASEADAGECVVLGAHFDHCGAHMGMVFPGANDNASGSAVVMEIARAFSFLESPPERSVMFVLFGGEEKGLEGSYWFAGHLPEAFTGVAAMINFDMVGEGDGAGCGYTPGLKEVIDRADAGVGMLGRTRVIERVGVRSSDYAPFFLKGAECISFYSNGPHLHYHKTGDTIYRINPDIMADIARLGFLCAYYCAGGG